MGVPTSEAGYTSAMPRREDHEVHKDMCGHWGGGLIFEVQPSRSLKVNPLDFYILGGGGGIKTLIYWAKIEREGQQHIFGTFKISRNSPGTFEIV